MKTYRYFYKVDFWCEVEQKEITEQGVIFATDSIDALQQLDEYYDENTFTRIEIYPCGDGPLTLTSDDWDRYLAEDM